MMRVLSQALVHATCKTVRISTQNGWLAVEGGMLLLQDFQEVFQKLKNVFLTFDSNNVDGELVGSLKVSGSQYNIFLNQYVSKRVYTAAKVKSEHKFVLKHPTSLKSFVQEQILFLGGGVLERVVLFGESIEIPNDPYQIADYMGNLMFGYPVTENFGHYVDDSVEVLQIVVESPNTSYNTAEFCILLYRDGALWHDPDIHVVEYIQGAVSELPWTLLLNCAALESVKYDRIGFRMNIELTFSTRTQSRVVACAMNLLKLDHLCIFQGLQKCFREMLALETGVSGGFRDIAELAVEILSITGSNLTIENVLSQLQQ